MIRLTGGGAEQVWSVLLEEPELNEEEGKTVTGLGHKCTETSEHSFNILLLMDEFKRSVLRHIFLLWELEKH